LISVEEARELILSKVSGLDCQEVPLVESLGCVLAEDVTTDGDISPFDNSGMDGFALLSSDVEDASEQSPVRLRIMAHIGAGYTYDDTVTSGQAVRIMTGAATPSGIDAVEKIENVTFTGEGTVGDELIISKPVKQAQNVRFSGEEAKAGEVVMRAGQTILPAGMGLLSSAGRGTVKVYRRPHVGVIALGSELMDPTDRLLPGKLRDSNSYALAGQALAAGCTVTRYGRVDDDPELISAALAKAVDECDFVVTSGGASAGDYDFITQVAGDLGEVLFKYVNMRPGKSQTFAVIDGTPFVGLAGNPSAAAVGFEMLVRPALLKMQGHAALLRPTQKAILGQGLRRGNSRRQYLRGTIARDGQGRLVATPAGKQSSALLGALVHGNCLIIIPANSGALDEGAPVECIRLDVGEGVFI